jgi:hypothetical protein
VSGVERAVFHDHIIVAFSSRLSRDPSPFDLQPVSRWVLALLNESPSVSASPVACGHQHRYGFPS